MRYNKLNRSASCKSMNGVKLLKVWNSKDVTVMPYKEGVKLMKTDTSLSVDIYVEDGLVDHTASPVEGGAFENVVNVVVKGVSNLYGKQLQQMACQRWIVQYEDNNGISWIVGSELNPMKMTYTYKNVEGTKGERNYTLSFQNKGKEDAMAIV